jgi:hypothetical protein
MSETKLPQRLLNIDKPGLVKIIDGALWGLADYLGQTKPKSVY